MQQIRILHVIGMMNCGGAEMLIMNLYRSIDRNKIQFDFLVHSEEEGYFDKEIYNLGGRIHHISRFKGTNIISYYREAYEFFKKNKEYKIVHGHIGSCASLYLSAAKKCGCFTIAHSHSTGNGKKNLHDFFFNIFSYPTRYIADYFFGCSTEAGLMRYGRRIVNSNKYHNFSNAIDSERFMFSPIKRKYLREQLRIEDKMVIGTVGRITDAKNPLFIIEIMSEYIKHNPNAVFLWVGNGDMYDVVSQKIDEMKLGESMIIVGQKQNVEDYLMAMDLFLFPSKYEGLPTSVIEAQATGLPCLLSDTITREVEITNLIKWMSIEQSSVKWANAIDDVRIESRMSQINQVIKSGYDIHENSKVLTSFYEKVLTKGC